MAGAAAETPVVILTFGDAVVETRLAQGLAGFAAEAEAKFGLLPKTYSFFDAGCCVDTAAALARAARIATSVGGGEGGRLVLEAKEHPEWRRMRALEARVEQLAAGLAAPAAPSGVDVAVLEAVREAAKTVAAEVEEKIMVKVENALANTRIELSHIDLKASAAASIVPLVQSMAMEQLETKALAKLHASTEFDVAKKMQTMEEEMESLRAAAFAAQQSFKAVQAEVSFMSQQQKADTKNDMKNEIRHGDWTVPFFSSGVGVSAGAWLEKPHLQQQPSLIAYSKKAYQVPNLADISGAVRCPNAPPTPLARAGAAAALGGRQQRLGVSTSVPQLPSVF